MTGVCLVDADKARKSPGRFVLLPKFAGRCREALARPTWWNLEHTLATLGLMLLLVVAALAWVASLAIPRPGEQTAEIIRRRLEHPDGYWRSWALRTSWSTPLKGSSGSRPMADTPPP